MLKKRVVTAAVILVFGLLAVAPQAFSCDRSRRAFNRSSARSYYGYAPQYRGVAGRTYYNPNYYEGRRYEGRRSGLGTTGRALLTIGGPAAVGAGVGALTSGKRGALVGALLGGGGGALYYLVKHRNRR